MRNPIRTQEQLDKAVENLNPIERDIWDAIAKCGCPLKKDIQENMTMSIDFDKFSEILDDMCDRGILEEVWYKFFQRRLRKSAKKEDYPKLRYGYISPEGVFWPCGREGHHDLEYDLKQQGIIPDDMGKGIRKEETWLEANGWLKLTGAMMTEVEFTFEWIAKDDEYRSYEEDQKFEETAPRLNLTNAQIDFIREFKEAHNEPYVNFNYNWYRLSDLLNLLYSTRGAPDEMVLRKMSETSKEALEIEDEG